jgi:hypothetical protein
MAHKSGALYRSLNSSYTPTLSNFIHDQVFPLLGSLSLETINQFNQHITPLYDLVTRTLEKFEIVFEEVG